MAKMRVGVLDLGSTSFNLLVADADSNGEIERVDRRREMLRLGSTINESGQIPQDVCDRAVETAEGLADCAREHGVDQIVPLATAALRDARNGVELSTRIGEVVGEPVRLLSGEQEARLIFGAFAHRVPLGEAITLGIDLGGGSCEFATGNRWNVTWETTLRIGVTRLHAALVSHDPLSLAEVEAIRDEVRYALSRHHITALAQGARRCVASGGTIRALARLISPRKSRDETQSITTQELSTLGQTLVDSNHDQRLAMPRIKRNRADLLPTGAVILETIAKLLEVEEIVVCDWGLREGAVLEALGLIEL